MNATTLASDAKYGEWDIEDLLELVTEEEENESAASELRNRVRKETYIQILDDPRSVIVQWGSCWVEWWAGADSPNCNNSRDGEGLASECPVVWSVLQSLAEANCPEPEEEEEDD